MAIARLEQQRELLLAQVYKAKMRNFDILHLLDCVVFSGFLKSVDRTKAAVLQSIRVISPDPNFLKQITDLIEGDHLLPSPSTILRNRLTVHLGYCVYVAFHINAELEVGIVRWSTLDLSPRAGYDS